MNKTYKKVFNTRRGTYVAVAENLTGHSQMGSSVVWGGVSKPSLI
ncbi:MAG: ESPR domain-containing protein, partial [Burkholderiaceae bacterium]|nr:ESPR domain-containing protein [Burkholderiaceae bacterium]